MVPLRVDGAILVIRRQACDGLDRFWLSCLPLDGRRIDQQVLVMQTANPIVERNRMRRQFVCVADRWLAEDGRGQGRQLGASNTDVSASAQVEENHLVAYSARSHMVGEPCLGM